MNLMENIINIKWGDKYFIEKEYICKVVFDEFLGISYKLEFIPDQEILEISASDGKLKLPDIFFCIDNTLWLDDKSLPDLPLRKRSLADFNNNNFINQSVPVIYGLREPCKLYNGKDYQFDIDLLGSIFFCLTRYEEFCGSNTLDQHGRFAPELAIAVREKFIRRAIVNEYVEILCNLLKRINPMIKPKERNYVFTLSHDVDAPLSVVYDKIRYTKKCIADIIVRRSPSIFINRIKAGIASSPKREVLDPNNNFGILMGITERHGIRGEYNFITTPGIDIMDGRYDITQKFFNDLLIEIHKRGNYIGFHPSYYTYCNFEKTKEEFNLLLSICDRLGIQQEEWGGRQHYLRWHVSESWQIWENIGADHDSSVAYAHYSGFRTGTCYDYPVFDLKKRKVLTLQERTLVSMELYKRYKNAKFDNIIGEMEDYTRICKHFKGRLVVLFHNNNAITTKELDIYESIIRTCN